MKGKTQKGITLIALIITIVVLLILAAVAISSIQNDGILKYAQNAADSWNKASQNEAGILDGYVDYLDNLKYQQCPGHTISSTTGTCTNCGYPCSHDWEYSGGPCKICNYVCKHDGGITYSYISDSGRHMTENDCAKCGAFIDMNFDWADCTYGDDEKCDICGGVDPNYQCPHSDCDEGYYSLGTGRHEYWKECLICDEYLVQGVTDDCEYGDDNICDKCGYNKAQ